MKRCPVCNEIIELTEPHSFCRTIARLSEAEDMLKFEAAKAESLNEKKEARDGKEE